MTPSARIQSAIELLDLIVAAAREGGAAADTILARWFAERRFAGSKDRRAIRGLVYDAIRLLGERPESGRAAMLALAQVQPELLPLFDGSRHGPAAIGRAEPVAPAGVAPAWLVEALSASGLDVGEQAALLERAPLDLRANRLKATREDVAGAIPEAQPLDFLTDGLRVTGELQVERLDAWGGGIVEVQDAGSQLVTLASGAAPGMNVVDLCAGAGGKTLTLAAMMQNRGTLLATDVDRPRLARLAPRAERAGATIVQTRLLDPGREAAALEDWRERADVVLIDAPCSGTGTWRRNPEARWRLTPARLERFTTMQRHVLELGADLVKPGGTLVYIVCSLLDLEGADQVKHFLEERGWRAEDPALPLGSRRGAGIRLTPRSHSTDGFFVAKIVRPC